MGMESSLAGTEDVPCLGQDLLSLPQGGRLPWTGPSTHADPHGPPVPGRSGGSPILLEGEQRGQLYPGPSSCPAEAKGRARPLCWPFCPHQ